MKENIPGLILKMLEVITLHNPPLLLFSSLYLYFEDEREKQQLGIQEDGGLDVWTVGGGS